MIRSFRLELRRPSIAIAAFLFAGCFATFGGCGSSEGQPIAGSVTYKGNVVTSGVVNFLPLKGKPFGGPIQTDGTYSCSIPPGEYSVVISAPAAAPEGWKDGDPPPTGEPQVPIRFSVPKTSGLKAKIDSDTSTMDFTLE